MSTIDQAKKPLTRSQKRDISSVSLESSQNKRKISLDSINKSNILDPPITSKANTKDTLTNTIHDNHAHSASTDHSVDQSNQSNQNNSDQVLKNAPTAKSTSDNTPMDIEMTETSENTSSNVITIITNKTTDNDKKLLDNDTIKNKEDSEKITIVTAELKNNSANNNDSDKMITETEVTNNNRADHNNEKISVNNNIANIKKATDQSNTAENTAPHELKLSLIASPTTTITQHSTITNRMDNQKNGINDMSTATPTPILQTSSSLHNIAHKKETTIKPAITPPEQGKSLLPLRPSTTAASTATHLKRKITDPKFTTINKSSTVRAPFSDRFLISSESFEKYSHHRLAYIVKDIVDRNRKWPTRDNKPLALSSRPPKQHSHNPHQQYVHRNSINTGTSSSTTTVTTNKPANQAQITPLGKNKDGNILDSLLASISSNVRDIPAQPKPPVRHNNKNQQRNNTQRTNQLTDLDIALMSSQ